MSTLKPQLANCEKGKDATRVFEQYTTPQLEEYITTLTNARKYTDLTMRDDFLVELAKHVILRRRDKEAMEGTMTDPPKSRYIVDRIENHEG